LENALESNNPVFVEMTADWCITCKVNHKTSINIDATKKVFTDENVRFLIGDWTNEDAVITDYLRSFGRNGVPIYVFYGRPDADGQRPEPIVLPQILTPGIVKNAVLEGE
jgi:thiol:disulfide interchange protein DsbD